MNTSTAVFDNARGIIAVAEGNNLSKKAYKLEKTTNNGIIVGNLGKAIKLNIVHMH